MESFKENWICGGARSGGQRTTSGASPHMPPCLDSLCGHQASWPMVICGLPQKHRGYGRMFTVGAVTQAWASEFMALGWNRGYGCMFTVVELLHRPGHLSSGIRLAQQAL